MNLTPDVRDLVLHLGEGGADGFQRGRDLRHGVVDGRLDFIFRTSGGEHVGEHLDRGQSQLDHHLPLEIAARVDFRQQA